MKFAKSIIVMIMFAIFILAIATASASDAADSQLAGEETSAIELSNDDETIQENENTQTQSGIDDAVGAGEGTYTDLRNEIGNGGNITLTKSNYHYNNNGDTIRITTSGTIDGRGAVIDMAGSTIRALYVDVGDVTIKNLIFKNANCGEDYGGAVCFSGSGTVENCSFDDNSARCGGAVCFMDDEGIVTNCNFNNNLALDGGAIEFRGSGSVTNCNFNGNSVIYSGGAIYFEGEGSVTNCNFANNDADGEYGGALYFDSDGGVTNCIFTDNSAGEGGAIYSKQFRLPVDTCIFKTDSDTTVKTRNIPPALDIDNFTIVYGSGDKLTFDLKTNSGVPVDDGYISFSLYLKGNNSWVGNYSCLSGEGWTVDLPVASYYAIFDTEYAEFKPVNRTLTVTIPHVMYHINVTSLETNNRTVNITAKSDIPNDMLWDGKLLFIAPDNIVIESSYAGNGTWWAVYTFDDYGLYQIGASYARLDNVSVNNATISMLRSNSTLVVDNVVMDYGESVDVDVTPRGAVGITAEIDGVEVAVEGYAIRISDLNAGNHTLRVATVPDYEHNSVNRTVNITVNKVDSTLVLDDVVMDYGGSVDVGITPEGAVGITAKIDGADVETEGFTVRISGLSLGNHTLMVSTVPDGNHKSVSKTVNISVNKANSTLVVDNIIFDYGSEGSARVSYTNASGVIASVIGQGDAVVNVTNNTITISNLDAGSYTLTVTTITDANHNNMTKTANITVNRLKTELTANPVSATYKISKNLVIILKDVNGKALTGVDVTVSLNGAKTYITDNNGQIIIATKALAAKVYTAKITFNGNTNYGNSTKDVSVTVKKAANPLKVKGKTVKIKFKKLKKKAQKLKVKKAVKFTKKGVGVLTFKKVKGNKKIKINKKTGKITIKKGLKKGKYKVKIKIKAKGNSNYNASGYKKVNFKIKIK